MIKQVIISFALAISATPSAFAMEGNRLNLKMLKLQSDLHDAVVKSNYHRTKKLLACGAPIEAKDHSTRTDRTEFIVMTSTYHSSGRTALIAAAFINNKSICKLLLDHGARINATDDAGWTALSHAVLNDSVSTCKVLITYPIFNPFISEDQFQESRQRIWTSLLAFKRLCPKMPRDIRKFILCWCPELTRDVEIACIWNTHQKDASLAPHMPLRIVRLLVQNGKLDQDATVAAIKARHMNIIKPFMRESRTATRSASIRALLNPDNLEENFGDDIERTIRRRLGLPAEPAAKCVVQ